MPAGVVDFDRCQPASATTFSQPIDMVLSATSALITVEDGIEQCQRSGDQLVSCSLAVSDAGFPVGLTPNGSVLYVADYSDKAIASYDLASLERIGTKSLRTSPTKGVFDRDTAYIVTQDIAGSVVLACNLDLEGCVDTYHPIDRALLGMAIYQGVAFLTDASGTAVIACTVEADGSLSDCAAQGDAALFNYPYGITIRNHVAYIPNRAEASVTVCNVHGRELLDCGKRTNPLLDGPTWVIFDD